LLTAGQLLGKLARRYFSKNHSLATIPLDPKTRDYSLFTLPRSNVVHRKKALKQQEFLLKKRANVDYSPGKDAPI
jgi:hypothetical protein